MTEDKFSIRLCSDLDYEEMVADICYEDRTVALVTQENGPENMQIEIFAPEKGMPSWKFSLNDLMNTVQSAKKRLIEFKKSE